jgi:alkanesulfonate monooxygenase SsuD/methylene tetrahydromethanopterin reductase-like flavin-dependent oxidoreductase (luciferase family)
VVDRANSGLRIGLSTPWDFWALGPEQRSERLAAAVAGGLDHVFCADHVSFHGGNGSDGIVQMATVAAAEPRLDVYVGVLLLALRHPMVAARQIATLAQAAPGRVTIGVGVGGEDRHEFEVCGIDPATRGRRTDAALDLVRRLLDGETVDGDGRFFDLTEGLIRPTPDPPVAFTVGGRSDAAVERAGRLGDGWLATWCSPRRFAEGVALAERTAAEADRGAVSWQHGMQIWLGVGDDEAEGRRHVAATMERFYKLPFEPFAKYTPCGTPARIAEALHPYAEAGATVFNLTTVGGSRQVEMEASAEIASRLRALTA